MKIYDIIQLRQELDDVFPKGLVIPEHTATEHWYRNGRDVSNGIDTLAPSVTTIQGILDKPYLRQWSVNQALEYIRANGDRNWDTNIISVTEDIINDAKHAHENRRDQAANWGTSAHNAIEDYINDWIKEGRRKETSTSFLSEDAAVEEVAACRSFDKFLKENEIVPIVAERMVWYDKAGTLFAGTADAIIISREAYKGRAGDASCQHDYAPQGKVQWCTKCGREVTERLIMLDHKTSNAIDKPEYAQQTTAYTKAIENGTGWKFQDIWITRYEKTRAHYEVMRVADRKEAWQLFKACAKHYASKRKYTNKLLAPLKVKDVIRI